MPSPGYIQGQYFTYEQLYSSSGTIVYDLYAQIPFFFSSRRRHTRSLCDWSSDVCSSDLAPSGTGSYAEGPVFWEVCVGAAEVEVDPSTGIVRVRRTATAADVGRAIN